MTYGIFAEGQQSMAQVSKEKPRPGYGKSGCSLGIDAGKRTGIFDKDFNDVWDQVKQYAVETLHIREEDVKLVPRQSGWVCSLYEKSSDNCPDCPAYIKETARTITQPDDAKRRTRKDIESKMRGGFKLEDLGLPKRLRF